MISLDWLIQTITSRMVLEWVLVVGLTTVLTTDLMFIPLAFLSKYRLKKPISLKSHPFVSVIVPAYNEEKTIETVIVTFLEQTYKEMEIVIVDDGSTDATQQAVKPYAIQGKVRLISRPNGGKSAAINTGLAVAKGAIIVVADADGIVQNDAIAWLVSQFEKPEVSGGAGNIRVGNRVNVLTKCQALEYIRDIQIPRRAFDLLASVLVIPGPLGAFRKSALAQLGTYDRDTVTEDFDATVKILKSHVVINEPRAVAYTEAPTKLIDLYRQRRRWYGGMFQTLIKHRFFWWKFGVFTVIGVPYLFLTLLVAPVLELVATGVGILQIALGEWRTVLLVFCVFAILEGLTSALALLLDDEKLNLAVLSPLYVLGYRQLLDIFRVLSYLNVVLGRMKWTSVERVGDLQKTAQSSVAKN